MAKKIMDWHVFIKYYICTNIFLLQIKKIVKTTFTSKVIMFEKTLKFKNIIIIYYGRHKIYRFTTNST
jgi:hypothetical protein